MNNDTISCRKKIIIANWKMNHNLEDTKFFIKKIINRYSKKNLSKIDIGISPSFPFLFTAKKIIKEYPLSIFSQNIHHMDFGAYTGEVSANMLKSIDINNVIIGHSERRLYEDDNILLKKLNLAIHNNFKKIVFCIGENEYERNNNKHLSVIKKQIENTLFKLEKDDINRIIIAYEPIWAIDSGKTAKITQIEEIHSYIRDIFSKKFNHFISSNIRIIYGGSINDKNFYDIFSQENIDGGIIGKYSLKYEQYLKIIDKYI